MPKRQGRRIKKGPKRMSESVSGHERRYERDGHDDGCGGDGEDGDAVGYGDGGGHAAVVLADVHVVRVVESAVETAVAAVYLYA